MTNIYGYISNGNFYEVGRTERGAKIAATKANCTLIGYRSYISNMFIATAYSKSNMWFDIDCNGETNLISTLNSHHTSRSN